MIHFLTFSGVRTFSVSSASSVALVVAAGPLGLDPAVAGGGLDPLDPLNNIMNELKTYAQKWFQKWTST